MRNDFLNHRLHMMARVMTILGVLGAAAVVILRVWLMPAQRDIDTGLFAFNVPVVVLMLVITGILAATAFVMRGGPRVEITGGASFSLALALLLVGAVMVLVSCLQILAQFNVLSLGLENSMPATSRLAVWLRWAERFFCLLGGVSLARLGWMMLAEGATRRGIAQWSILAPVIWMWLVLANYEMSYSSMVRLTDGFFTLAMYIAELLFLLCLARYMAGVGRGRVGVMLFCSCSTVLFALSAPLVRVLMYLLQDSEAYAVSGTANVLDLAIGLLALTISFSLGHSVLSFSTDEEEEEEEEEAPVWSGPTEGFSEVDLIEELDEEANDEESPA